jgi:hypothetical protein
MWMVMAAMAVGMAGWFEEPAAEAVGPFDGRHIVVTATVDAKKVTIQAVEVRPGTAHAQLADSSSLRVELRGRRGRTLGEFGYPNPLFPRIYRRALLPSIGEGGLPSAPEPPHDVETKTEVEVSIVLPLLPQIDAVVLGWRHGGYDLRDVTSDLRLACGRDDHRACKAWMNAHP